MKSSVKSKGAIKAAHRNNTFKLLTSTAMIAMALGSVSSIAGPGKVCLDGTSLVADCTVGTIGTYYANSPKLRKFVDTLPGLTPAGKNSFKSGAPGEYISVAIPDVTKYPGSEYFIIGVVEHQQRMHSDLVKPTTLRSYVQLYPQGAVVNGAATNTPVDSLTKQTLPAPYALKYPDGSPITWPGTTEQVYGYDKPNYLGPIILTPAGTPVRTMMVNLLPKGKATVDNTGKVTRNGDMFLPVDESLGGAGLADVATAEKFPQNRVSFHLHGGDSPWISDGTPHQWITPAGEATSFKSGNRMFNVPDMPFPGEGALTLYWPNDQSARLMWYHDHSFGLTRQNAYGGNAAGYVIYDNVELALQGGVDGTSPTDATTGINKALPNGLFDQIVLVIQDKTFVPNDIAVQDSKWDTQRWGQPGDLWFPHVYEPFQLWGATAPAIDTDPLNVGANPAGRWDYAVNDVGGTYLPPKVKTHTDADYGEVAFPDGTFGNASTTPEAYMDTPVINGVAYPTMTVEPKAYRVRFLNGANDRYFNLSLWVADSTQVTDDGRTNTELKMVPPGGTDSAGNPNPSQDAAGIPDPATAGPNIIQFANEAGFLPQPVVHKPTLMPYAVADEIGIDPANFYMGSAERADTVIDFSQYAGKTLILYNDGAAPVPGGDPRYDYYTGNPDQTTSGGAPSTIAGYGPNTRTLMQFVVAPAPMGQDGNPVAIPAYDPSGNGGPLAYELPKAYAATADKHVDVAATNPPAIAAMPKSLDAAAATLTLSDNSVVNLKIKTIHGLNEPNIGRLVAQLGTELPLDPTNPAGTRVETPLAYIDAPTEIVDQDQVQYWWIRNYDVDNHPMHFHLFNVQVLAHYDPAANTMRPPTDDELGWKETVKNWPAEDLLVALKPKLPQLPFGLPNSVRTMDPTMHDGATSNHVLFGNAPADGAATPFAFSQLDLDPNSANYGGQKPGGVSNTTLDYGWEYVWHCHILGHEENDLMRPLVFRPNIAAPAAPANVTVDATGLVKWDDPTPEGSATTKGNAANEMGFVVERVALKGGVPVSGTYERLRAAANPTLIDSRVSTLANAVSLAGPAPVANTDYIYQVAAVNEAKVANNPTIPVALAYGSVTLNQTPAAPTAVTAVQGGATANGSSLDVKLSWADNATNETGYTVQRNGQLLATLGADATSFTDTIAAPSLATTYAYTVTATNAKGDAPSAVVNFKPATALVTPTSLTSSVAGTTLTLNWVDQAFAETGYVVKRATGTVAPATGVVTWSAFAQRPTTTTILAANATTLPADTLAANTLYQYQVSAATSVTVGRTTTTTLGAPAAVILTTATTLPAPTKVAPTGTPTVSTVGLQWNNSTSKQTTGYEVERCVGTVASCNLATATWVPATGTLTANNSTSKFIANGLNTKTTYTFRIAAVSNAVPGAVPLRSPWTAGIAITTR